MGRTVEADKLGALPIRQGRPRWQPDRGKREDSVHTIRYLSWLLVGTGLALALAGEAFNLGAVVTLIGLMLVIAGVVKVVTVRIWHGFFADEPPRGDSGEMKA